MVSQKAESPIELRLQKDPRVRAEAGHIILRLELIAIRDSSQVQDIELVLERKCATQLATTMLDATVRIHHGATG
jgi:hypothetical protein